MTASANSQFAVPRASDRTLLFHTFVADPSIMLNLPFVQNNSEEFHNLRRMDAPGGLVEQKIFLGGSGKEGLARQEDNPIR